jgi:hypothetical protein
MTDPAWTRHLPPEARAEMDAELATLAGDDRTVALAAWHSTAEVYADPELLAALSAPSAGEDHGPVPPPGRPLYRVTTVPWQHGLELHIDGVGVTQTHDGNPEGTVEAMARDYIAAMLGVEPDSFDLAITDPETTAAIQRGFAEAERGETVDLGSFEQYLDDEDRAYEQAMRGRKRGGGGED